MDQMGLTEEEKQVAEELRKIFDEPDADAKYDKLPDSMGGKILNADIARELSPRYQSVSDRTRFTRATYEPARDYVYARFMRELKKKEGLVIILAGGAASGKTTSIQGTLQGADLVFDSNCADISKAKRVIDAAVGHGWSVVVVYIHRNFRIAVESMLKRAILTGRSIPLRCEQGFNFAELHFHAQRTFVELDRVYSKSKSVRTIAFGIPGPRRIHNNQRRFQLERWQKVGKDITVHWRSFMLSKNKWSVLSWLPGRSRRNLDARLASLNLLKRQRAIIQDMKANLVEASRLSAETNTHPNRAAACTNR